MTFALSKLLWALISPSSLLILLLGMGLLLSSTQQPKLAKTGRVLCAFVALALATIAIFPVGDWALTPLENRFAFNPPDSVYGIIVIGGDERTDISEARAQPTALDSMRRYVVFADLARRYPDAKLVFSGGSVFPRAHAKMIDSDVALDIMASIGVPTGRMTVEKNSRNTYENAIFSAALAHPEPQQKWLLVTAAWHMPRAMGCFRRAGWNVSPAPAGYDTTGRYRLHPLFRFAEQMRNLTLAVHEYIGLVAYWLMGRTNALWP
ncbi:MAG: YdcF family protein [Alphaproteobacteria bacterium]|nr:YdcF family protein [Alphaproteobacteria bacterium]